MRLNILASGRERVVDTATVWIVSGWALVGEQPESELNVAKFSDSIGVSNSE